MALLVVVLVAVVLCAIAAYFLVPRPRRRGIRASDASERAGLPPGASTRGEGQISGTTRDAAPYDEAPGEGKFAPGADNPPPVV